VEPVSRHVQLPMNPAASAGSVAQWHPRLARVTVLVQKKAASGCRLLRFGLVPCLSPYNRNQPPLRLASSGIPFLAAVSAGPCR